MRCSHNVPYESKCWQCVESALKQVAQLQQQPKPQPVEQQRSDFWLGVYNQFDPTI